MESGDMPRVRCKGLAGFWTVTSFGKITFDADGVVEVSDECADFLLGIEGYERMDEPAQESNQESNQESDQEPESETASEVVVTDPACDNPDCCGNTEACTNPVMQMIVSADPPQGSAPAGTLHVQVAEGTSPSETAVKTATPEVTVKRGPGRPRKHPRPEGA